MKGSILYYDAEKEQGLISGEDSKRYSFTKEDIKSGDSIAQGVVVDFMSEDGECAVEIYSLSQSAPIAQAQVVQPATQVVQQAVSSVIPEYVTCKPGGLFSWKGCYSRSRWWGITILLFFTSIALFALQMTLLANDMMGLADDVSNSDVLGVFGHYGARAAIKSTIMFLTWPVLFWIALMTSIKRFHDANMSGVFWLLNLIPFIGPIIVFIINGFVGSAKYGNMYCVKKDAQGRPILKGSGPIETAKPVNVEEVQKTEQVEENTEYKQAEEADEISSENASKKRSIGKIVLSVIGGFFALILIAAVGLNFYNVKDVKSYYSTGELRTVYQQNFYRAGPSKSWYRNGQIESERYYGFDHNLDGVERHWHKNGQLRKETFYKYGTLDGTDRSWDEYGNLISERVYVDGKLQLR